jgi:hypothetical protein
VCCEHVHALRLAHVSHPQVKPKGKPTKLRSGRRQTAASSDQLALERPPPHLSLFNRIHSFTLLSFLSFSLGFFFTVRVNFGSKQTRVVWRSPGALDDRSVLTIVQGNAGPPYSHHASLVKLILPSRDRPCSSCITSLREMQPFEGIVHRPCLSLRPRQHGLNRCNVRVSSAQQRSCDSAIYMIHMRIGRQTQMTVEPAL